MKDFLKMFGAVLLAFAVISLLPFLFLIAIVGSIDTERVAVQPGSVLTINLDESIYDSPRMPSLGMGGSSSFEVVNSLSVLDVSKALEAAAEDDNIKALYLHFTGVGMIEGTAQIEELRGELLAFKERSGKPIVAYNETYSQGTYWLSSVADEIYLHPQGGLDWRGLASQVLFYKGAIDKLGVDVQIVRHGTYKSAVEPYMLTQMSPANRRQTEAMVNSLWSAIVSDIATSREISAEKLQRYAAELAIASPADALSLGLVDGLKYEDEVVARLEELSDSDELTEITLGEYSTTVVPTKISRNKVAIIYADGQIIDGEGGEGIVGGATTAEQVRRAREDESVKAVVLRVNSPGGSALASDVMWRELKLLGEEKPLVVSMSNYAASGGYYISAPAGHIVANRTTLTGSIGVFGLIVSGKDVLEDKLGVSVDVAKTAPHADMGTMFRPLSATEMAFMQRSVEDVYTTFVGRVAEGRKMAPEAVNAIGEGRVWSGVDAQRIGLVNEFGGLRRAVEIAAERAELGDDWRLVEILEEESELSALLNSLFMACAPRFSGQMGTAAKELEQISREIENGSSVLARMPYHITIY